ncbi:MAG: DsbA family oxidoreductase [Pseudomonadota bacterium]
MLIEVFADLVCPWCYIGKNRLAKALAERPNLTPTIRWLPFQLNPDMPLAGMERGAYLSLKFGSPERALQVTTMLEQTAERDGITLNLDRINRTPNTIDAHRVVRFAARGHEAPVEDQMVNHLMDRYFIDGDDISDSAILIDAAEQCGLDGQAVKTLLEGDDERAPVRNSDLRARRLGIHAVPCFIIDQAYAIAGAHETETFGPLFDLSTLRQDPVSEIDHLVSALSD